MIGVFMEKTDSIAVTDSEGSDRESVSSLADSVDDAVALDGGNSVRANSNLKLIQKLGLGSMVKQLLFDQKKPLDYMISRVGSLKAFTSVLQALLRGLPEEVEIIEPFAQMVDLVHMGMIRDNIMLDECRAAFKSATDVLINKYPNVNSIIAMPAQPHEVFQKLIVDLAVGYDKQLTKFVCDMPVTVPYTLLAPNLVELDLRFIHSWTLKFPTIYPRSLRKIDIVFEDVSIDWDVFHVDKESKAIVFDNLTDLSIKGDAYILELRNVTNANDLDLKFPNLERLFLDNELTEATEFLENIKEHYPTPSSSKIKTLRLIDENSALHSYSRCKQTFGGVIENLKWYWPQLRDIKFEES
ncbi:hypothetical protein IW148_001009 [Coemansia sp. RSA 1199]|nr:hypothetical protein IW148_001009 [Coemansia sp. RSA 1199]